MFSILLFILVVDASLQGLMIINQYLGDVSCDVSNDQWLQVNILPTNKCWNELTWYGLYLTEELLVLYSSISQTATTCFEAPPRLSYNVSALPGFKNGNEPLCLLHEGKTWKFQFYPSRTITNFKDIYDQYSFINNNSRTMFYLSKTSTCSIEEGIMEYVTTWNNTIYNCSIQGTCNNLLPDVQSIPGCFSRIFSMNTEATSSIDDAMFTSILSKSRYSLLLLLIFIIVNL